VDDRRNGSGVYYEMWVTGYVTAFNHVYPATYDILGNTDITGAMLWLENHCRQNPLRQFGVAVNALINELYPTRTTQAPK